jgi:hypothetical protein
MTDAEKLLRYDDLANLVDELRDENMEMKQQLAAAQQALRNVYEVWVGISIPTNAVEKYLLTLIKQMRDAAKEGMK